MLRLVVLLKYSDVPEMLTASIIRTMSDLLDDGGRKPPKGRSTFMRLHSANSQKAVIFILAAVRTLSVTCAY
jgi:hypothetical protein